MDKIEPQGTGSEDRKTYLNWLDKKLKELETKLDEIKLQAHLGKADVKTEYSKQYEDLNRQRDKLRLKMDELKDSGGEAWDSLKDGLDGAYREMKTAVERAIKAFK
jgi:chaperonin cofactor prefoldin